MATSAIIEGIFNKINTHKGVEGIILADIDGIPLKSTFKDEEITYFYTTSASMFVKKCRHAAKTLVDEKLTFIRLRTKLNEIVLSPEDNFILIVVQNPTSI